ncbi:DUF11 domain-containing protein [Actinomadura litoris]|uniref:DUF11 domain-containing protein n=1 Tax=Actinomadura litoris TaxID=2678616 RepID=A0A7K1KVB2_9ACTN|nr:DUF11 domain-containing protein [Actinomadura litoris]MUN36114.1 DUF11 domain-containing protein [Actinomadura litoris]
MFGKVRERAGARGLVLLAATPLLGVVPMQDANGGTRAEGPVPAAHDGRADDQRSAPAKPGPPAEPKPKTDIKPKAKPKTKPGPKPAQDADAVVRLSMVGPGKTVVPGRTYDWPFAVTVQAPAKGRARAHRAVLRVTFPKTLKFVSGQSNCTSGKGGKVTCRLGVVKPGRTVPGVLRGKVARHAGAGRTIMPGATVTWGTARARRMFPASRVARTADLVMSKKAPAKARAGAVIRYVMRVRNLGPSTAENVVVRSRGHARLIGPDNACAGRGAGYTCAVGSLRPGESRTLRTRVRPDASARAGTTLESPSTATTSTIDVNPANNRAVARTRITGGSTGKGRPTPADGSTGASRPTGAHGTHGAHGSGTDGPGATSRAVPPAAREGMAVRPLAYAPEGRGRPAEAAGGTSLTGTRAGTVVEIAVAMVGAGFVLTRLGRRRRRSRADDRG